MKCHFCCLQPPARREGSCMCSVLQCAGKFGSLLLPVCTLSFSPCLSKQINLIMKGRARKRKREREKAGWRKTKLKRGEARIKTPNRDCHGRRKNVSLLKGSSFRKKKKTTSGCKISLLLLDYLTLSNLQGSHPN